MCLVDAVQPAFGGNGPLACLLLEPANTAIVGPPTDYAHNGTVGIANRKNDPAGEIVAIIACKRTSCGEIGLLKVITVAPGTLVI